MRISVLMLTHCAPRYVKQSIVTLKKRTDFAPGYELIVVDNDSDRKTRRLLSRLYFNGLIDKLAYAGENLMFARGNNVAAELCSAESEYVLLLNSDIEVRRADWMARMVEQMESDRWAWATATTICPAATALPCWCARSSICGTNWTRTLRGGGL